MGEKMAKLDVIYKQIGRQCVLNYAAIGSGLGKLKPKNCKTGFPCGYSCISKTKNCKSALKGQAKNYADWLALQSKKSSSEKKPESTTSPASTKTKKIKSLNPDLKTTQVDLDGLEVKKNLPPASKNLAQSIAKLGGMIDIPVVERTGIDSYRLIHGEKEYASYQEARKLDPDLPDRLRVFIAEKGTEKAVQKQLNALSKLDETQTADPQLSGRLKQASAAKSEVRPFQIDMDTLDAGNAPFNPTEKRDELRQLSQSIAELGGLLRIPVVERTGLDSYKLISGHAEYMAYQDARKLNPDLPDRLRVFIAEKENEQAVRLYLDARSQGDSA